jgi:hypothetical protein
MPSEEEEMKGSFAKVVIVSLILALGVLVFSANRASAFPSFARRYETSCTTCHVLPPKLNAFGVAFKNNGYRMSDDDEKFIKQPDIPMGSPGWKKVWPKGGVWPGAIQDRVPLSGAIEMVTDFAPQEPVKVDFAFPEEFELLMGGTLGTRFSYLGELAFEFSGGETEIDFERGFLNARLTESPLLNLRIGRFEPGASPFSRFSYRLTGADFITADFRALSGGFRFRSRQQGFELWGAKNGPRGGGLQYSLGLVNGSGSSNDDNSHKDFYASASYKIGGYGVTGQGAALDTLKSTENYIDNSVEVGAFTYIGRLGTPSAANEVRYNRAGFKVNAYLNRLNLFGAYVHGRDFDLESGPPRVNTNAWFTEGDVVILPWVMGIFRYDQAIGDQNFLHVKRVVPGMSFMIRANIILSVEGNIYVGKNNNLLNGSTQTDGAAFRLSYFF